MVDILKLKNCNIDKTVDRFWRNFVRWHISLPELTGCSEIQILRNPRCRTAAILKTVKCNISLAVFSNFDEIWYESAARPTRSVTKNLKIWTSQMTDVCHLENRKIAIAPKPFGLFWRNFARWQTRLTESSGRLICVIVLLFKNSNFIKSRWRTAATS